MVKQLYVPPERRAATELDTLRRQVKEAQRPTATERDLTLQGLQDAILDVQNQQAKLTDAARVASASVGTTWSNITTWVTGVPSISFPASLSGRYRITVSGGASGGLAIFTFQAPGFNRDRALGGSGSAINERFTAFGGASVAGSSSRSWIVSISGAGPHTITAEAYPSDSFVSIIGLSLEVQALL